MRVDPIAEGWRVGFEVVRDEERTGTYRGSGEEKRSVDPIWDRGKERVQRLVETILPYIWIHP